MPWKFNDPFYVDDVICADEIRPVFDGKNVWVMTKEGIAKCLEFWGPYADDNVYPNDRNVRWQEPEVDILTYKSLGPKLRVIKEIDFQSESQLAYHNDFIYAFSGTTMRKIHISAPTGTAPTTVGTSPVQCNSEIACYDDKIFFIRQHLTTQVLDDLQTLYSMNINTGVITDHGLIPGKKQKKIRSLLIANDTLYISSYNTHEVVKYNPSTGAYLTSVFINRDVETLLRTDTNILIVSSSRGNVEIDGQEFPNSMISELLESDTVNNKYGIIGSGSFIADDGTYVWSINDYGGVQRTHKTSLSTVASAASKSDNAITVFNGEAAVKDDKLKVKNLTLDVDVNPKRMVVLPEGGTYQDSGINPDTGRDFAIERTADAGESEITTHGFKNLLVTPERFYQYWDGTQFINVTVPKHLFLLSDSQVMCIRLPRALKWESEYSINQYAAVSTGGKGYKEG